MTTYEILDLIGTGLGVVIAGIALYKVSNYVSVKKNNQAVGSIKQDTKGNNSPAVGRDYTAN